MGSPKTKQLGNQVKHLLFISILIFSSFLTSCEKKEETLYKWETSSGSEWKTMGDENDNLQYKGEVKREYIIFGDYIFDGLGSLTHPDGRKYVGKFKDGKFDGQGTYTHSNGSKYVGKFKEGLQNGQGTYTSTDGFKYVGVWKNGKSWGDWEFVVKSVKGDKSYYDKDRLRKNGKFLYFWTLTDYLKPFKGNLSQVGYVQLD